MKKNKENDPETIKPDLKHDTMEYAASTDGDDILDIDNENNEEDEISAEELEFLEDAGIDEQAAALNSVEIDRTADDDVIFDVNDIEEYDEEQEEDEEKNEREM